MPTRRQMLLAAAAASVAPRLALAKASQPASAVNFEVPAGACDCHTHIHGEMREFPMFAGRVYTPEPALPEEMAQLHKALHLQRVVIVTPSVYGTDNSATLWGMKARGKDARGVAVIDEKIPESALDAMHQAGVRGVRINLATGGNNDPALGRKRFQELAERVRRRNWHVQMNTNLAVVSAMKDVFAASPVPVVFDHFANARHDLGTEQPGFADLVELVRSGKGWVKVSVNGAPLPDYSGFAPLAQALIAANPERIVWGSNWPHPHSFSGRPATELTPLFQVDDGLVLNQLPLWAPDAGVRRQILVDNPARLYGFTP